MFREGTDVWVNVADGGKPWTIATVLGQTGSQVRLRRLQGRHKREFSAEVDKVFPVNDSVEEDMCRLNNIDEPNVLSNIEKRALEDKPYSFVGPVLVSLNPLKYLDESQYACGEKSAVKMAHPFSIAESAFQQMTLGYSRREMLSNHSASDSERGSEVENKFNQSIVIGGDSGSGKTESSKRAIKHLVTRCENMLKNINGSRLSRKESNSMIERRLLLVSPILELIGNAATLFNGNSSRFGKYTIIYFSTSDNGIWKLEGAKIETYLLERSRVVFHATNERTFHIMYCLVAARAQLKDLGIEEACSAEGFASLGPLSLCTNEDLERFEQFSKACISIGISEKELQDCFRILAAILHLSNVDFDGDRDESKLKRYPDGVYSPSFWACRLLGIDQDLLESACCTRKVTLPGNNTMTRLLGVDHARNSRNSFAKALYISLFDWIVAKINIILRLDSDSGSIDYPFIGVLDIFGFENMPHNSMEQMLINYANEALQENFMHNIFLSELNLYREENLMVDADEFSIPTTKSECTTLFYGDGGKSDMALLSMIDEASRLPSASDDKIHRELHRKFIKHSHFKRAHPRVAATSFVVVHYPGEVTYSVAGFLEKNSDQISVECREVLSGSTNSLLVSCFGSKELVNRGSSSVSRRVGRRLKEETVVSKFSKQMTSLIDTLASTECSYIRCVKPNLEMTRKGAWFNHSLVLSQLRNLSIPQTVQVLKSGLPTRITYQSLLSAYSQLMPRESLDIWKRLGGGNERAFVKALLWAFDVPRSAYKFGSTRLFFRSGQLAMLERILSASVAWTKPTDDGRITAECAFVVSRFKLYYVSILWRKCVAKAMAGKYFEELLVTVRVKRHAAAIVAQFMSMVLYRSRYLKLKKSTALIQRFFRGYQARKLYHQLLKEHEAKLIKEREARLEAVAAEKRRLEEIAKQRSAEEKLNLEEIATQRIAEEKRIAELEAAKREEERLVHDIETRAASGSFESWHSLRKRRSIDPSHAAHEELLTADRSHSVKFRENPASRADCLKVAERIFGINPSKISEEMVEEYRRLVASEPAGWEVLATLLMQYQLSKQRTEQQTLRKHNAVVDSLKKQLQESEVRYWELKVVAKERDARISELTLSMGRMEVILEEYKRKEMVLSAKEQLESGDVSVKTLMDVMHSQQSSLLQLFDDLEDIKEKMQNSVMEKETMTSMLDTALAEMERERTEFTRNSEFLQERVRELEMSQRLKDEQLASALDKISHLQHLSGQDEKENRTSSIINVDVS